MNVPSRGGKKTRGDGSLEGARDVFLGGRGVFPIVQEDLEVGTFLGGVTLPDNYSARTDQGSQVTSSKVKLRHVKPRQVRSGQKPDQVTSSEVK